MAHRHPCVVAAADLDELGHVNNARYLDYLERGRTTWYDEVDLFETARVLAGCRCVGTVVVNLNIDFVDECLLGQALMVETVPLRIGGKSFTVAQRILKVARDGGAETLAARAHATSVVMDLDRRRAVALPSEFRRFFPSSADEN